MKLYQKLILVLIIVVFITTGCKNNMQYIVRYNIDKTEFDCMYSSMSEKDLFDAFGAPHVTRNKGAVNEYFYYVEDIVLHVTINNTSHECWADISSENNKEEIYLPKKGKVDIDHNKYLRSIKSIDETEIQFIDSKSEASLVQERLGAPHEIEEYTLPNGFVVNSFVYKLKDSNSLYIVYSTKGIVGRAWIEDSEGNEIKIIIEIQ